MEAHLPYHHTKAILISDSRGKFLDTIFNSLNEYPVEFTVCRRNGARLADLWEIAESAILFNHPDIIYLYGGVCDLTEASYLPNGLREFWPSENFVWKINKTKRLLYDIVNNFELMYTSTKLCILPEPGLDLIRYNNTPNPVPRYMLELQEDMEDGLKYLQKITSHLNSSMGMETPWFLDITHARRHRRLIPVYDRLRDGLHPGYNLRRKICKILVKHAFETTQHG